MENFLICDNRECRFILDQRLNGESVDGGLRILRKCPECGSTLSSKCSVCSKELAVKFVAGVPRSQCCGQRLPAEGRAA